MIQARWFIMALAWVMLFAALIIGLYLFSLKEIRAVVLWSKAKSSVFIIYLAFFACHLRLILSGTSQHQHKFTSFTQL